MIQLKFWFWLSFLDLLIRSLKKTATPLSKSPGGDFIKAEPWTDADRLFHSNPVWLGADDAYSEDLGGGRVLWLFGDTFIATSDRHVRSEADMIRNSVGIQNGYDPSGASMEFFWAENNGQPGSFFPEDEGTWFWPGDAVVVGNKLIVFLMAIKACPGPLGFEVAGWRAVSINDFHRPVSSWVLKWLDTPPNEFNLIVSGSVTRAGDYIYGYSEDEDDHTAKIVRWPVEKALEDDLTRPQWWCGDAEGWVYQDELTHEPRVIYTDDTAEFTVDYIPDLGQYLEIQTMGFGPADMAFRLSDSMTGPWSPLTKFYEPSEYDIPQIMIYAGKAHPEQAGAELVLTYATNSFDYDAMIADENIYFPRFLKARYNKVSGQEVAAEVEETADAES